VNAGEDAVLTIALYNLKGGVGKTTVAVNLACLSAADGRRTLLWDLDPQGSATFYLGAKSGLKGGGDKLIHGKRAAARFTRPTTIDSLDVLPADFANRRLDTRLAELKKPRKRLPRILRTLATAYDTVFIDCPPGASYLSENVFRAADALLVPVVPTVLSERTLAQVLELLRSNRVAQRRIIPFFSMVDRRKSLHRKVVASPPTAGFCRAVMPALAEIERMGVTGVPVTASGRRSRAVKAFRVLWDEIKNRITQ